MRARHALPSLHVPLDGAINPAAAFTQSVQTTLLPLADADKAPGMAAYMQGKFVFLGVQTPLRRQATQTLIRVFRGDALDAAEALWDMPARECQYVAADLLRARVAMLAPESLPRLLALVTRKSWWDTVDALTPSVGEMVLRHPSLVAEMDGLLKAEDFWLRRVALLYQLQWKTQTDEARLFRNCLALSSESEFFIRKAIGWALRQYARSAPDTVRAFLAANRERLSPLSLREAGKHL